MPLDGGIVSAKVWVFPFESADLWAHQRLTENMVWGTICTAPHTMRLKWQIVFVNETIVCIIVLVDNEAA